MKKVFGRLSRILLPIVIIVASIVGFNILRVDTPDARVEVPEQRAWPVNVLEVETESLTPTVQLFGQIVIPGQSELGSILDSKVVEVRVRTGQTVRGGEILVRLDTRNIDTQVKQFQADIARINASLQREAQKLEADRELLKYEKQLHQIAIDSRKRIENLIQSDVASQSQLDETYRAEQQAALSVAIRESSITEYDSRVASLQAELARTKASLDRALLDVADSVITAPFSGRITNVYVAPGNRVRNGTRVLDMYDPSQVEIRALIPNRYLSSFRNAATNNLTVTAQSDVDSNRLNLEFDRLSSEVSPGRGGVDAYFRFGSNQAVPELGRSIDLSVFLPTIERAIAIPYQAVYGSNQVFKVVDNLMKVVTIQRFGQIERDGHQFIVANSSDLEPGDELVVTQLTNAVDGLRVEPWR